MAVSNNGVYIKNAGVNSGNAFWLKGATMSYDIRRQIKAMPIVGKSNTAGTRYQIATVEKGALENPTITIRGSIDLDDTDANEVTERLLKDLARDVVNDTFITVTLGINNTQLSNYKGTNDTGLASDDNIQVEIQQVTFSINSTSERGHIIGYNIAAREST